MVYIIGLLFLSIICRIIKNNDVLFLIISGVFLILLMGLRSDSVGTDSKSYYHLFSITASGENTVLLEKAPMFHYFMKGVSSLFGTSTIVYFTLTAILIIVPLWIAIYFSKVPCRIAVIIYYLLFFQTSLNGTRTYISVAFIVLAYILGRKRNRIKTFMSIALLISAFFIHKIAVIGIAIIGLSFIKLENKQYRRFAMFVIAVICLFLNTFTNIFMLYFGIYADTLNTVKDTVGASAIVFQGLIIFSLLQTLYLIIKRKDSKGIITKKDYDNMAVLLWAEAMLFIVGGTTWYVQRLLIYLQVFIIFLIPVVDQIPNKFRQLYRFTTYLFAGFLFCYGIFRNLNEIMPYTFFWQ